MGGPLADSGLAMTVQTHLGRGSCRGGLPLLLRTSRPCPRLSRGRRAVAASAEQVTQSRPEPPKPTFISWAVRLAAGAALLLPLAGAALGLAPRSAFAAPRAGPPPPAEAVIDNSTGLAKQWLYTRGLWSQEQYRSIHRFYTTPQQAQATRAVSQPAATTQAATLQAARLPPNGSMSSSLSPSNPLSDPNSPLASPTAKVAAGLTAAVVTLLLLRAMMPRPQQASEGTAAGEGGASLDSSSDGEDGASLAADLEELGPDGKPRRRQTVASVEERKALVAAAQSRIDQAKQAMAAAMQAQQELEAARAEQQRVAAEAGQSALAAAAEAQPAEQLGSASEAAEEVVGEPVEVQDVLEADRKEEAILAVVETEQQSSSAPKSIYDEAPVQLWVSAAPAQEAQQAPAPRPAMPISESAQSCIDEWGRREGAEATASAEVAASADAAAGASQAAEAPAAAAADPVAAPAAEPAPAVPAAPTVLSVLEALVGSASSEGAEGEKQAVRSVLDPIESSPSNKAAAVAAKAAVRSVLEPPGSAGPNVAGSGLDFGGLFAAAGKALTPFFQSSEGGQGAAPLDAGRPLAVARLPGSGAQLAAASSRVVPQRQQQQAQAAKPSPTQGAGQELATTSLPGASEELAAAYARPQPQPAAAAGGGSGGSSADWNRTASLLGNLLLAPVAPLFADLPHEDSARGASARGGQSSSEGSGASKYDMLLSLLQDALRQPDVRGDSRYDPVRGLLRLAPPSGPQRYDFAASLLRGMGSEQRAEPDPEGEALARRFDMVWDLVKGMRADAEAAAAAGLSHGSKYDPVWRLLEEARLDEEWGVARYDPLQGLSQWGPAGDWDTPAPYDPLPDLFAAIEAGPQPSKYDPMVSLLALSFSSQTGSTSKYDMLAEVLEAMSQHESAARVARAEGATGTPNAKLDPWGWLVAWAASQPAAAGRAAGDGSPWLKLDPFAGGPLRDLGPVPRGAPPARYDFVPGLLAAQAPTVVSKYDLAQELLEGRWMPLATADPLEIASVPALVYSMPGLANGSALTGASVGGAGLGADAQPALDA